jgi:hypothetical protein
LALIQKDWFTIAAQKDSNAQNVMDHLNAFYSRFSNLLLERIVNMTDENVNFTMYFIRFSKNIIFSLTQHFIIQYQQETLKLLTYYSIQKYVMLMHRIVRVTRQLCWLLLYQFKVIMIDKH